MAGNMQNSVRARNASNGDAWGRGDIDDAAYGKHADVVRRTSKRRERAAWQKLEEKEES